MIYLVDVVWCNHLARTRNYIFGRCGVVQSSRSDKEGMIYLVDVVCCNHLARTRNDIFGRCGVVQSSHSDKE